MKSAALSRGDRSSNNRPSSAETNSPQQLHALTSAQSTHPFARFAALLVAFAVAAMLTSVSAMAVSEKEAATVVELIEALQDDLGDFAYDEVIAEDWFEQDADNQGLIQAAGFSEDSWKRALGETYRGFLANVPEAEILETFADARRRVERAASLTADQKQALLQETEAKKNEILQMRAEGKPFAAAVRPLVARIRALSKGMRSDD